MNGEGKYINLILKKFYKREKVVIKFILPNIFEQNSIFKYSWCTLDTFKNIMLTDSKLFHKFWSKVITTAIYLKNLILATFKKKVSEEFWTLKN